jgi:cysteine desulfurase
MKTIYLDYNATTPVDEKVFTAMVPYLRDNFGNPSSSHVFGRVNREAIVKARAQVAQLLGCDPGEVIFTGGGSESNNHAIKGVAWANRHKGNHIITSVVEHPAVTNPCRFLEERGYRVTCLPVDQYGQVNPDDVEAAITEETILITIMHANNEVGTLQPIAAIGNIARRRGVVFHTDAAQSVGKVTVRVDELNVDLLTVAGHKFYGPKGVGALYIRKGTNIEPFIHGAGHEQGRRAGTENVAYIVALGTASELAYNELQDNGKRLIALRDKLHQLIAANVDDVVLNGHPAERLPNTLNLSFKNVFGAAVLAEIPEIAASTGSACHDGSGELSGVLKAMGVDPEYGFGSIRFSLGKDTNEEDIQYAAGLVARKVQEIKAGSHSNPR